MAANLRGRNIVIVTKATIVNYEDRVIFAEYTFSNVRRLVTTTLPMIIDTNLDSKLCCDFYRHVSTKH